MYMYVNTAGLKSAWNRPAWTNAATTRTMDASPPPPPGQQNTAGRTSNPFVLFTAGAMGAGKSHTLRWLAQTTKFPLQASASL